MNILGVEYTFSENKTLKDINADGICQTYDRKIEIVPRYMMLDNTATLDAKDRRYNEVMRHEIIHAFFTESGLDDYSNDELLVQFLAAQFPKLKDIFKDQEVLD